MPKITLELDNEDMAELDAAGRAKHVSSEKIVVELVKAQLLRQRHAERAEAQMASSDVAKTDDLASRQAARRAALLPAFGMWVDDDTKPKDGVAYQKAIRAEWE